MTFSEKFAKMIIGRIAGQVFAVFHGQKARFSMSNGRYSQTDTPNRLVGILLVLLILFMVVSAFLLGFLLGQRYCNVHSHGVAETTEPPEITAPIKLPETQAATAPVEKNDDKISIPGFERLDLQAHVKEQKVVLPNPAQNTCLFRISLILEDDTVLWTSDYVKPGEVSDPIVLNRTLGAGSYPNAKLKFECFTQDTEMTPLNGAETKLTLRVK